MFITVSLFSYIVFQESTVVANYYMLKALQAINKNSFKLGYSYCGRRDTVIYCYEHWTTDQESLGLSQWLGSLHCVLWQDTLLSHYLHN